MIPALLTEPSHHDFVSNSASLLSPRPPARQQSGWATAQGPWLMWVWLCCSICWIAFILFYLFIFYKTVPTESSSSLLDFSVRFNFNPRSLLLASVSPGFCLLREDWELCPTEFDCMHDLNVFLFLLVRKTSNCFLSGLLSETGYDTETF